jgi:hypothetical protein
MKAKPNAKTTQDEFHIRDIFGFLWDYRERQIHQRSFWYGYLLAVTVSEVIDIAFDVRMPSVPLILCLLFLLGVAKWIQASHPLK